MSEVNKAKEIIESAWENIGQLSPSDKDVIEAVNLAILKLDNGELRIAEKKDNNEWYVNQWLKKAVLISFRINENSILKGPYTSWYDKVRGKSVDWDETKWKEAGYRHVPNGTVRQGSFIGRGVVLMPCFVNIGAYVDEGTMVDTWATVGSCAQIGKNCHLSGGVGIGGVLEPLQAAPVIIEDNSFIGSRCVIVEGVKIETESVLGANVVITSSTKIIDVSGAKPIESKGIIPKRSVVIPGSYTKKFNAGEFQVPCALIIGKRKESTDKKTSLNNALREYNVSV